MSRICIWAFALFILPAFGQSTATLAGDVLDPGGRAVPGAEGPPG